MRELTECVASHALRSRDRTKCYLKLSVFPPDTGVAFCDWQSFGAKGSGDKANKSAERGHPRLEVWESVGSLPGLLQSVAVAVLTSSFWGAVWNISSSKRPRSCQNLGSNSGVPASNLCFFVCFNTCNSSSNAVLASRAAVLSAERPAKVSPVKKELLFYPKYRLFRSDTVFGPIFQAADWLVCDQAKGSHHLPGQKVRLLDDHYHAVYWQVGNWVCFHGALISFKNPLVRCVRLKVTFPLGEEMEINQRAHEVMSIFFNHPRNSFYFFLTFWLPCRLAHQPLVRSTLRASYETCLKVQIKWNKTWRGMTGDAVYLIAV